MNPNTSTARQERSATTINERLHRDAIIATAVPIKAVTELPVA